MHVQNIQPQINKLQQLKLNNNTITKILSATKENGERVFNKNGLNSLVKLAKMKDTTFFSQIMKNLDGLDNFKKKFSLKALGFIYMMHSTNQDKTTTVEMQKRGKKVLVDIETISDKDYYAKQYSNNGKKVTEIVTYPDYDEKFEWDKQKNTITRQRDINGKTLTKTTKFSQEGVIELTQKNITKIDNNFNVTNKFTVKDYSKNIKINALVGQYEDEMKSQTKTYTNPLTGRKEIHKMTLSPIVGVYNSTITDDKGNTKVESVGRRNPDGTIYIEKNLESLDGTTTHYTYNASKDNKDKKIHYQIKTAKGEVLSTVDRTFKRVNSNLAYSSINGHSYVIESNENTIDVTDNLTGKKTIINKYSLGKEANPKLLDKMSGDMLLDMYKRHYVLKNIEDNGNSFCDPKTKTIHTKNNMYVASHELGHSKDIEKKNLMKLEYYDSKIGKNPVFREAYEIERFNFMRAFPEFEQKYINYFIDRLEHYNGFDGGAEETVAESNAILSTSNGHQNYATREYYLQKYFPRTIAAASRLLMPNGNIYVNDDVVR